MRPIFIVLFTLPFLIHAACATEPPTPIPTPSHTPTLTQSPLTSPSGTPYPTPGSEIIEHFSAYPDGSTSILTIEIESIWRNGKYVGTRENVISHVENTLTPSKDKRTPTATPHPNADQYIYKWGDDHVMLRTICREWAKSSVSNTAFFADMFGNHSITVTKINGRYRYPVTRSNIIERRDSNNSNTDKAMLDRC